MTVSDYSKMNKNLAWKKEKKLADNQVKILIINNTEVL